MSEEYYILITGATGFLGKRLAVELLERRPHEAVLLALVRASSWERARRWKKDLYRKRPQFQGRVQLVQGDITCPDLGLASPEGLLPRIREIFHLAALYDLACPAEMAERINVQGTCHLLDLARRCASLQRFHYVSTCYVAGDHEGIFREEDLDMGQGFLNHYDRTKFLAEQRVRQRMGELPVTIYRPAIVAGDSRTGEIDKFDGPYFVMNAMRRLPRRFAFLRIGSGRNPVNIVPVDFAAQAMAHLSGLEQSLGKCYHLADPAPLSALELERALMEVLDRRFLLLPTPLLLAQALLAPRFVQEYLGLPAHALPYFDYPVCFDTANASAHLSGSGISCPRLLDYLPVLVAFWRRHRGENGVRHRNTAP